MDLTSDVPVLLRSAGEGWPVYAALQEEQLRGYQDRVLPADLNGGTVTVRIAELLDDLHADPPRGLYLRHQRVSELDPALWQLVPRDVRRHNWLLALPAGQRPDWAWVMIGARGTRTALHVDTMASAAWNLLCAGRKKWTFYSREDAVRWGLLPTGLCEPASDSDPRRWEFVQDPGDVVVTPSGWAHEVDNLTGTISITANYINDSNLDFAQRYFALVGDTASLEVLDAVRDAFSRL